VHNVYRSSILWLFAAGVSLLVIAWIAGTFPGNSPVEKVRQAEQLFREQDNQLFAQLKESSRGVENFHDEVLHDEQLKPGMSMFVFDRGSLIKWSDNGPDLEGLSPDTLKDASLLRLPNGIYWQRLIRKDSLTFVGLLLFRHQYTYENRYLQNGFNPILGLPESSTTGAAVDFHGPNGKVIDRILLPASSTMAISDSWCLILWLGGFILTLTGAFFFLRRKSVVLRGVAIVLLLAIRGTMLYLQAPVFLYETALFDPALYASSVIFHSLGDFILNGLVVLYGCLLLRSAHTSIRRNRAQSAALAVLLAGAVLYFTDYLIDGLVADSHISFSIEDLAAADLNTLLGLFGLSFYFLAGGVAITPFLKRCVERLSSRHAFLALLFVTIFTSLEFQRYNERKELNQRLQVAQRVAVQRDPAAEYFLQAAMNGLPNDSAALSSDSSGLVKAVAVLKEQLSHDYLSRFEASIYRFDAKGIPVDGTEPLQEFIAAAQAEGELLLPSGIYLLPAQAGRVQYIAIQTIQRYTNDTIGTIAVAIRSRTIGTGQGFPELFIGGNYRERSIPEQYSYASYRNGKLEYEFGPFPYSFGAADFTTATSAAVVHLSRDGFDHLVVKGNPESFVVVSKPTSTWMSSVTLFSWLFTFFSIVWWLLVVLLRLMNGRSLIGSLTRRIRMSVFLMVVLSFLGIGTGTVLYIFKKYDDDQRRTVAEQLNGLWVLLGENAGIGVPLSRSEKVELPLELQQIAANTNFDFNVFDEAGRLYYSSQPRIFDQGVVSMRMNAEAYHELNEYQRTQFIHRETVGNLNYIAAYAPFIGAKGEMTGYLHLPYFEKQQERNREISGFLSALLNIYVLLFAIAVFLTAFVSSRITQPLSLIQERLAGIRFGRKSEPIEYAAKDEIGQLVVEYNRMLKELADSADKLARSERETAWREMAKQVAHEIKNPLTPMKLSVQQLQRAWKEHRDDREAMTEKMAQTLIQQIDTLSAIATEFSNFAKMPQANPVELDLNALLTSTVALFSSSYPHEFRFSCPQESLPVMADKDQMNRVFSNLIKNAVQAIPDDRNGIIEVHVVRQDESAIVTVRDNGVGIPEELIGKIFVPNFTTKSGGTGLGLAMVKNIVEQSGGEVSFTSIPGEGTTFTVRLQLA